MGRVGGCENLCAALAHEFGLAVTRSTNRFAVAFQESYGVTPSMYAKQSGG